MVIKKTSKKPDTVKKRKWIKITPTPECATLAEEFMKHVSEDKDLQDRLKKWPLTMMEAEQLDKPTETLNPLQELFCRLYTRHWETYWSWVKAYAEAYWVEISSSKGYKVAQAASSRLLSKVIVSSRINEYLQDEVLNDSVVDSQLAYLITQHDEKWAKLGAIKEYNALKQRITQKIENNTVVTVLSKEEQERLLKLIK